MLLSFEILYSQGAFAVVIAGAMLLLLTWSGASSPAGVEEHVQTDNWGSPGTWEILSSPRQIPGWSYRVTNSRPRRWVLVRRGAKRASANRGIAKRRQRSAARRVAGSRNALIVPLKQGNSPRRTLWRGSEASAVRLNRGKHAEHIEVP